MKIYQAIPTHPGLARMGAFLQSWLRRYVDEQADVFESLIRQAAPYGSNWVASRRQGDVAEALERSRQQIASLKAELGELREDISSLGKQLNSLSRQQEDAAEALERARQQIAGLKAELDEFGKVISRLGDQLHLLRGQDPSSSALAGQHGEEDESSSDWKKERGINRFRVLHANEWGVF